MNLKPEEIQEIVEFFEKHTQFWKRSVFLNLIEENKSLKREIAAIVDSVNDLSGKYQTPKSWEARSKLVKDKK